MHQEQHKVEALAMKGKLLDLDGKRKYSFGNKTGAKNLVDSIDKPLEFSLRITNDNVTPHFVALVPMVNSTTAMTALNPTIYPTRAALIAAINATPIFDGAIIPGPGTGVVCDSLDSQTSIESFIRSFAKNPTRLLRMQMRSVNLVTNDKDSTNYDGKIKTIWMNPFDVNESRELGLRPLVQGQMNFNPDMLTVDFIEKNFPVVLSDEHIMLLQVNAKTSLTITFFIGAQDSKSQRFWREMKKSDDVIRSVSKM